MGLNEFLLWLGSASGASGVASFILERIPAFHKLASEAKQWVYFFVCLVLSVGSYSIITYVPADILEQIAPFFALVAAVFASVFLGSVFHQYDKIEKGQG